MKLRFLAKMTMCGDAVQCEWGTISVLLPLSPAEQCPSLCASILHQCLHQNLWLVPGVLLALKAAAFLQSGPGISRIRILAQIREKLEGFLRGKPGSPEGLSLQWKPLNQLFCTSVGFA